MGKLTIGGETIVKEVVRREWQKPNELAIRLINHTTKENDIIIDPFACTGTFILNGANLGRKTYGCDIDKNAINIAYERGCKKV